MAARYVVGWRQKSTGKKLMPVDEKFHGGTVAEATLSARGLLVMSRTHDLMPEAVIEMTDDSIEEILLSDRQMIELGDDEFVVLGD